VAAPFLKALAFARTPAGRKVIAEAIRVARSEEGRKLISQARKVATSPEGKRLLQQARQHLVSTQADARRDVQQSPGWQKLRKRFDDRGPGSSGPP
jgi:hypothetical protein